jgi:hypothetical protein
MAGQMKHIVANINKRPYVPCKNEISGLCTIAATSAAKLHLNPGQQLAGVKPVSHLSPHLRPGHQLVGFGPVSHVWGLPGENDFPFWLSNLPAYLATAPA